MKSLDVRALRFGYLNTLSTKYPLIQGEADCQWGFAFGRGSYGDKELGKILQGFGANVEHDIAVFEMLRRDEFLPGGTNEEMAAVAWNKFTEPADGRRFPFFGQWEINYAMWRSNQKTYEKDCAHLRAAWAPPDMDYYPTHAVARDLAGHALANGHTKPLVMAHESHIYRVIAVCWKLGWNVLTEPPPITSWDEKSVQPATRRFIGLNPLNCWFFRETAARAHHLILSLATLNPPPE